MKFGGVATGINPTWLPLIPVHTSRLIAPAPGLPAIVKVRVLDPPPPGSGFCTVTEAVPPVAMSLVRIVALIRVGLRTVVARPAPFQRTTEPLTKLLPFTVSVKLVPPGTALLGDSAINVGAPAGLPLKGESTDLESPRSARRSIGPAWPTPPQGCLHRRLPFATPPHNSADLPSK